MWEGWYAQATYGNSKKRGSAYRAPSDGAGFCNMAASKSAADAILLGSPIFPFGIFFWSILTVACGLTRNYWQIFMARIGVGVGEATLSP